MDTLELNYEGKPSPVLWRNKTPQDIYRERYSECHLEKVCTANKSLVHGVQECDAYYVKDKSEKGSVFANCRASLIPIPEKP
jgi:hypothetical protein